MDDDLDALLAEARELENPNAPVVQRRVTVTSRGRSVVVELPDGCTTDEADALIGKALLCDDQVLAAQDRALRGQVTQRSRRPRR
jgi:hypothetical protein